MSPGLYTSIDPAFPATQAKRGVFVRIYGTTTLNSVEF